MLGEVFPEWMPVSNPVDLWPAIERNGPEAAWQRAFKAVCDDPGVDAIFFHVFVGGFSGKSDISSLVDIARDAGKPVFAWLLGKRPEARHFMIHANQLNVPVFKEIQRAVECMAAVFKRSRYLLTRR
jgi:acetyltransferase